MIPPGSRVPSARSSKTSSAGLAEPGFHLGDSLGDRIAVLLGAQSARRSKLFIYDPVNPSWPRTAVRYRRTTQNRQGPITTHKFVPCVLSFGEYSVVDNVVVNC
jgi:hypothetical protein